MKTKKLPKKPRWKDKIDPAFDKIIKFYIQFVELVGLPANKGWIRLEDEPLKLREKKGKQGWIKGYEERMTTEKNTIFKLRFGKGVTEKERNKARRDFGKQLLEQIKILPEESKDYYKKTFAPLYSETVNADYFRTKSSEEVKEILTDFLSDTFVLSLHVALVKMENECESSPKEALEKKYIRQSMILDIVLSIYNSISLLVFGKSLTDLIKEARDNNNEEAFFKLLQIDRTVVECDWAQKMIRKAQLSGDEKFFKKMKKAIGKTPLDNTKQFTTARMVILVFWELGLRKLVREFKYHEIRKLLKGCGLRVQESDPFRRFVQRLEKAATKREIITFYKGTPAS